MQGIKRFIEKPHHLALIEELVALDTAEDKLSWLMERQPIQPFITPAERLQELRIPGCLSGLWLSAAVINQRCSFRAASESDLVQGVVGFICDIYSDRSPEEILEIKSALTDELKLDGLLSVTRKRAVSSALSFILTTAQRSLAPVAA